MVPALLRLQSIISTFATNNHYHWGGGGGGGGGPRVKLIMVNSMDLDSKWTGQ